jgi:putative glycosyltransferase (TIGR04372 family)
MTPLRRLLLRVLPRRFIYLGFRSVGRCLDLLPRRVVFRMLVLCDTIELKGRHRLCQAYLPRVTLLLAGQPAFRFATGTPDRFHVQAARVLHGIGAYRETCDWITAHRLEASSVDVAFALLRSRFELGEFEQARADAAGMDRLDLSAAPELSRLLAMLALIADDLAAAVAHMDAACRADPSLLRPHQNIAARSPRAYVPNALDRQSGALGRLFDLGNFAGQRVTHVGRGETGVTLFARALEAQARLRAEVRPALSADLERLLSELGVAPEALRLIPEEWTTQIGHLGMLDILFRMQDLGWWSGQPVMVVRRALIANPAFFRLFGQRCTIVIVGETVSESLAEELLSLQRWVGLGFNAFRLPDGRVVPWQEAGALAIAQWEREGRGHPLRAAYDALAAADKPANDSLAALRARWGMTADDWHVCLHVRDAAYYLEFSGTGQTHRNAPIESYLEAIRFITDRGGWVIKLGGPNSPRLPPMPRAIDYALGGEKSDLTDIQLIRHARAFIGTTSGLTNVAISFGVPCAIVNAITTDAQLWTRHVRFALKPVRQSDGAMLTQRELTSTPWRWRVFDAAVLGRNGAAPVDNSSMEILQTVQEVMAMAEGRSAAYEAGFDQASLLSRWQAALSQPHHYGTGRISLGFLAAHADPFLGDAASGD